MDRSTKGCVCKLLLGSHKLPTVLWQVAPVGTLAGGLLVGTLVSILWVCKYFWALPGMFTLYIAHALSGHSRSLMCCLLFPGLSSTSGWVTVYSNGQVCYPMIQQPVWCETPHLALPFSAFANLAVLTCPNEGWLENSVKFRQKELQGALDKE